MDPPARNRLAAATSPYLRQHANNPVDWYPWGEEALRLARELDRPILLSIGYSACHWCHVMAHESFEDPATAELMNRLFINIKVDREERPDLDRIYQTAHQLITQRSGGWPLTMFLTADEHTPYYGGTYFPPQARMGLRAFREVLEGTAAFHRERREEVREQGRAVVEVFGQLEPTAAADDTPLNAAPLAEARRRLGERFDAEYGGFGEAPKFPHPGIVNRLLRHGRSSASGEQPDVEALYMATLTLARMAEGGLFDQLAGGFFRYCVDRYWQIPHFEKMLYDNAQLLPLYANAWRASGDERWRSIARATAEWVITGMQAPAGGFCSTLDADSEDGEGRYYLWTPEQLREHLSEAQYAVAAAAFGLDLPANFEARWHLQARSDAAAIGKALGLPVSTVQARLEEARLKLLEVRARRAPPARDEKILAGWNGLMIAGLAAAARALPDEAAGEAAQRAMTFVRTHLWRDGRLHAAYADGGAYLSGYLDDHAALLDACLQLLQLQWDGETLDFAVALAEIMLAHFEDRERGGFYFTADDHEQLIHRSREFADDATPAGNAIAALALQRLGLLLGEPRYLLAAERTLRGAWQALQEYPHAHASLLDALEEHLQPPHIIILRGTGEALRALHEVATAVYAPARMVLSIPPETAGLPAALAVKAPLGEAVAYHCIGLHCSAPLQDAAALAGVLREGAPTPASI